jgi:hypothetical protein
VADKLADAQRQIAELSTLAGELRHAAAVLELHRPDGPCDAACGCVTATHIAGTAVVEPVIERSRTPAAEPAGVPIACSLTTGSLRGRMDDWKVLLEHVANREPLSEGIRAVFHPTVPLDDLIRLAAAERECCPFLAFAITVDARGIGLEITAPSDAVDIVHALFGEAA